MATIVFLDLYHAQSFFLVFLTWFPSSIEQEQRLEKVIDYRPSDSNLHNLFSTLFLLTRAWKKSTNSYLKKLFLWQIYSKKILLVTGGVKKNSII